MYQRQKYPRRGHLIGKRARLRKWDPGAREALGCWTFKGRQCATRSTDDAKRNHCRYLSPASPMVKPRQIVRPHDPDQPRLWVVPPQRRKGIGGIASAPHPLIIRNRKPRPPSRKGSRPSKTLVERRILAGIFERVLRADQPPDAVEPKGPPRRLGNLQMALMGRIERPTEHAHPQATSKVRRFNHQLAFLPACNPAWHLHCEQ